MKKYQKPTLVRRDSLARIAATCVAILSNTVTETDNT
jgi:hypothetical protein